MNSEWLTTYDAIEYLGCYPELFGEIRRRMPDFPCCRGASKAVGHAWDKRTLDAMRLLREKGLPWLICARVAALGEMNKGVFVIR